MINGEITFDCEGTTIPELAEYIRTKIGGMKCEQHGQQVEYDPAHGASNDHGTLHGKCTLPVKCCCQPFLNKVKLTAFNKR